MTEMTVSSLDTRFTRIDSVALNFTLPVKKSKRRKAREEKQEEKQEERRGWVGDDRRRQH